MRQYFDQIIILTLSNLKTRYRNTVFGFIWVMLNPILIYGAQSYAFSHILKLNVANYSLFLVTGLIPWIFLTNCIEMTMTSLLGSSRILKSLPIHPFVIIASSVLDNLVNFVAAFFVLLIPLYAASDLAWWRLLFYPLPILWLLVGACSLGFLMAILQVFFRDSKYVISFVLHISFFLTPTFYPESFVPENLKWVFEYNFLYYFIKPFRFIFNEDFSIFWMSLGKGLLLDVAFVIFAALCWKKIRNKLYFYLS